jgi:diguanylate cyclase (GGDEF)-like protein
MDPTTLISVLALQLVCTGGLLCLIGRQLPPRQGVGAWGVGGVAFGIAYYLRLRVGLNSGGSAVLLLDSAMFGVALSLLRGLRQFSGHAGPRLRTILLGVTAYLATAFVLTALFGVLGRHLLLNGALASVYLVTAAFSGAESMRSAGSPARRTPLRAMMVLIGVLGVATATRIAVVLDEGVQSLYAGRSAEVYYSISALSAILLGPVLLWMLFVRLNGQLADLAMRDALTRLLNRNGLDDAIARHFASRTRSSLTLMEIDIDHFKRINDTHGHSAGDVVLRAVGAILAAHVRGGDFVARMGGEEFLLGCANADAQAAYALAERVRAAIAAAPISVGADRLHCTVSVGVSRAFSSRAGWDVAFKEADDALYDAKRAGRDRVIQAPAAVPSEVAQPVTIERIERDTALQI